MQIIINANIVKIILYIIKLIIFTELLRNAMIENTMQFTNIPLDTNKNLLFLPANVAKKSLVSIVLKKSRHTKSIDMNNKTADISLRGNIFDTSPSTYLNL